MGYESRNGENGTDATSRRRFILGGLSAVASVVVGAGPVRVAAAPMHDTVRTLAFRNLHTGETLDALYWEKGRYVPDALAAIDHVLRDHRTDEVAPIDRGLLDLLHRLRQRTDPRAPFHVISGFRSARTNAMLAARSDGVATRSFHMLGMAIDVRMPGRDLRDLHRVALSLHGGGVGWYGASHFIHVDIGPVRRW